MAMDRSSRPMHRGRKKVCSFCVDRVEHIDYKDLPRLRKYVSERAKIIPRRVTGTYGCHQACPLYGSDALRERLIRASGIHKHKKSEQPVSAGCSIFVYK